MSKERCLILTVSFYTSLIYLHSHPHTHTLCLSVSFTHTYKYNRHANILIIEFLKLSGTNAFYSEKLNLFKWIL